jgi:hypothetical protein
MLYTKIAIVAILGAILFSGGFIGGIFTQNYLKILPPQNPPSTQPPPQTTGENLTIQSHALLVFSKQAIQFNLKNTGTTNIQVADVKMNGYSNQTPTKLHSGHDSRLERNHSTPAKPNRPTLRLLGMLLPSHKRINTVKRFPRPLQSNATGRTRPLGQQLQLHLHIHHHSPKTI